jgi:hypothetical protein
MRIFDEVVELIVEQRRREQSRRGEQPVTRSGDGDREMLPNEEGNERRAPVSLVAGTCRSGRTICVLWGPGISKNFLRYLKP